MHIDYLADSPETSRTATPRRPTAPPQYFAQQQLGYGIPMSHLQRLYATAAQEHQQAAVAPPQQEVHTQPGAGRFPAAQQAPATCYPDARQKKFGIRHFDGKELYVGLGSGYSSDKFNVAQSA